MLYTLYSTTYVLRFACVALQGSLSAPNYIKYVRHDTLGTEYINSSIEMASAAKFYYDGIPGRMRSWHEIQQM